MPSYQSKQQHTVSPQRITNVGEGLNKATDLLYMASHSKLFITPI